MIIDAWDDPQHNRRVFLCRDCRKVRYLTYSQAVEMEPHLLATLNRWFVDHDCRRTWKRTVFDAWEWVRGAWQHFRNWVEVRLLLWKMRGLSEPRE